MTSSKTLKTLSGKYHQSRSLSSDVSPVLALQGFNALTRSTVSKAPINLSISQETPDKIEIKQSTTASIPAITEQWTHDWEWREFKDAFMGKVKSRSRWVKAGSVEESFLKEGIEPGEEVVEAEVQSLEKAGWFARQIWCVEEGDKFVRRVITSNNQEGSESVETRLVYEPQ